MKKTVIVVGAGISGLTAASALAKNYNIILIEAADQCGGRIRTSAQKDFSSILEAGAEFIHGHLKQTLKLLKKAGIDYVPVKGKMYRKEKGSIEEQKEMIEGWDKLLKKMKRAKKEMTMHDFLHHYFAEDKYADLRRHAVAYTEGFDVADVKKVTVHSLYKEWSAEEEENFRIPEGYGELINYLVQTCEEKGCRIITKEAVKQIDWQKNDITVITSAENKYTADKIVISIPISVLQQTGSAGSVNFTPPLDGYINAARQIGFGTAIKILISFHKRFWKKDMGFIFGDEYIPTWWTQLPDSSCMLTGWVGGSKADHLCTESDNELLEKALISLSNIFDLTLDEIKNNVKAAEVFNWKKNPLALGAYSYDIPGAVDAKKILNTPVKGSIFFCGEALYEGDSPGTVEAAIVSARQMLKKIRKSS
ncbi:MAG: NAD(P)/FAD-dependent oxidoreductase [Ferruginibacter sp.]